MSAALMPGFRRPTATPGLPHRHLQALAAVIALLLLAVFLAIAPLQWAALGVGAAVLGAGLLVEPALALFVLAALLPWSGSLDLPVPTAGGADLLVGAVIVLWLARGVARREIMLRLPPLAGIMLLFIWVAGLTLTQAFSWRDGLPEWLKWVEFGLLYVVAAQLLGPKSSKWLVAGLFAGGLSQVALGAYQFVRQAGPEAFILPGGFMRAYGSFMQPNPYSGYLGYLAPVAASLGLWAGWRWWRERRKADLFLALVLAGVTMALVAGIVMSWSRGGWLGLSAALAVVVALRNWRTAALMAAAAAILVLAITLFGTSWLPSAIAGRVQDLGSYLGGPDPARTEITDENFSVLERLAHWQAGARMFEDRPWLGVGIGNYGASYARYPQPHWYEPLGHAHNVFINFAAETGILGLVVFVMFWFGVALFAARMGWAGLGWISALATGVLGTWTYLTVHGLFDNLFVQHMQLQLALLLAVLAWAAVTPPSANADALSQPGQKNGSRSARRITHVG